jgi:hypothetical protein
MKKPWRLVPAAIVLALGVIIVLSVARPGRKLLAPPPDRVLTYGPAEAHFLHPGTKPELAEEDTKGLNSVLQQYLHRRVKVEGWVTSVESDEAGGRTVKIDVDAPGGKSGGPTVTVFVAPEAAKDPAPAVGAKASFQGSVSDLRVDSSGRLLMELRVAAVTPPAGKPRATKPGM